MSLHTQIIGYVILFFLIFGMSATVEYSHFKKQVTNTTAIWTGIVLQFFFLPLIGFVVVKILDLDRVLGIALLLVTSSPGGSYSNWWCSLFNADLALSVTMTAISTLLAMAMLPLNVFIYTNWAYGSDEVNELDWLGLGITLAVVLFSIATGLSFSACVSGKQRQWANKVGNLAGVALIIFSVLAPEGGTTKFFGRPWEFYFAVTLPILFGMIVSTLLSTSTNMKKPERVALVIECTYQNTGIAISVVLSIYSNDEQAEALGIPFAYTGAQALLLGFFCVGAWKVGWTNAPADKSFWSMLFQNYETTTADDNGNNISTNGNEINTNDDDTNSSQDSNGRVVEKLIEPLAHQ